MTGKLESAEASPAQDKQNADGDDAKPKPGGQKTRSGKKLITWVSIVVLLVVAPGSWAAYVYLTLSWASVTLPQPHDHKAALSNVLELQDLALSEAQAGRQTFFYSHIGCASPPVWQNDRLLQNLKRMVMARVDVKLIGGLAGYMGEALPSPEWPMQFEAKLRDLGIDDVLLLRAKELRNHSAVAGSARRTLAYICLSEERYVYPTKYFRVRDNEACGQWKQHLLRKMQETQEPPAGGHPTSRKH